MSKKALTDIDIAALAAGATGTAAVTPTAEELAAVEAKKVADAAKVAADLAASTEAATEAKKVADAAAAAAATVAATKAESELVQFLRAQVKEKDEQLVASAIARKEIETKLATADTTHVGLLAIARGAVSNLRVALGGSAGNSETLGAVEALAEHKTLAASFKDKFKVGGVAAVTAKNITQGEGVVAPALHAAKVAATRTSSPKK